MEIKNLNKEVDIKYQTKGSAGIDVCSRKYIVIPARSYMFIPLGIIVKAPKNTMVMLLPRSSLFRKKKVILANSIGVIDEDYCGDDDEIKACLYNMTNNDVAILKNERICQLIVTPIEKPELKFVNKMNNKNRGGFGSTD